jgi:hypothetical protein
MARITLNILNLPGITLKKIKIFNVILAMGLSTSPGKKGVLYPELH